MGGSPSWLFGLGFRGFIIDYPVKPFSIVFVIVNANHELVALELFKGIFSEFLSLFERRYFELRVNLLGKVVNGDNEFIHGLVSLWLWVVPPKGRRCLELVKIAVDGDKVISVIKVRQKLVHVVKCGVLLLDNHLVMEFSTKVHDKVLQCICLEVLCAVEKGFCIVESFVCHGLVSLLIVSASR